MKIIRYPSPDDPHPGDHIRVSRGVYDHHGIFWGYHRGQGYVIHLSDGIGDGNKSMATVRVSTLGDFLDGAALRIVHRPHPSRVPSVLARAVSKYGRGGYNLLTYNCEHFASWCISGKKSSKQASLVLFAAAAVLLGTTLD